jgi:hypothetical protein
VGHVVHDGDRSAACRLHKLHDREHPGV